MYTCENCGGNLKFDIVSQKIVCPNCNSHFDPYSIQKERDAVETEVEEDTFHVTVFSCPQCGGEIYSTDDMVAGFCSFCGASTILSSRISKEKKPGYIIPFSKTKEDCKAAYVKMMRRAIFAPKELKDKKHIDSFRGIYMPYWVYSISHEGDLTVKAEDSYRRGDYLYTDHYNIEGIVDCHYKGITFDASASFSDTISEKIAPFDVKKMKEFTPSFLCGFYADTSNVESKVYEENAFEIAARNTERYVMCESAMHEHCVVSQNDKFRYVLPAHMESIETAMFPVWFMSYQKDGRITYATVNGQTGKVVADIPVDIKKFVLGSVLLAVPIYFFLNAALTVKPDMLLMIVSLIALSVIFLHSRETVAIYRKDNFLDDKGAQMRNKQICRNNVYTFKRNKKKRKRSGVLAKSSAFSSILVFGTIGLWIYSHIPFIRVSLIFVLAGAFFVCGVAEPEYREIEKDRKIAGNIGAFVAIGIAALILLLHPVMDIFYYAGAVAALVAIFFTLFDLIKKYNISATRKLPQFDRRGGDDRA